MSTLTALRDALAGELARHLSELSADKHDVTAAQFRRYSEDYRTLARMRRLPAYADKALESARALPGAGALDEFVLLRTLSEAYDIAAALRKH
ncbi:MAG: hypothetical protein AAF004_02965 [Pseudomonadota bacterium]